MCGDVFVVATYTDGFRRNGTQIIRRWSKCPRNGDARRNVFERYQMGRCMPPHYFACANELRAWNEHRPWRGACDHRSVSVDGSQCWTEDGQLITGMAPKNGAS